MVEGLDLMVLLEAVLVNLRTNAFLTTTTSPLTLNFVTVFTFDTYK